MKKLLTLLVIVAMVVFTGQAMAGWSASAISGGYVSGNVTPNYTVTPGYNWTSFINNQNVGNNATVNSGITGSGTGGNVYQTYQNNGTTSAGVTFSQSGGISVTSIPGMNGSIVRSWSSSRVVTGGSPAN
jgi:hypothetical protein